MKVYYKYFLLLVFSIWCSCYKEPINNNGSLNGDYRENVYGDYKMSIHEIYDDMALTHKETTYAFTGNIKTGQGDSSIIIEYLQSEFLEIKMQKDGTLYGPQTSSMSHLSANGNIVSGKLVLNIISTSPASTSKYEITGVKM
jgi:hypothetical protein